MSVHCQLLQYLCLYNICVCTLPVATVFVSVQYLCLYTASCYSICVCTIFVSVHCQLLQYLCLYNICVCALPVATVFVSVLVGAILEHEAIAGLSAGKPTGLRGRALSNSRDDSRRKDASLDSLMKAVSRLMLESFHSPIGPSMFAINYQQSVYMLVVLICSRTEYRRIS